MSVNLISLSEFLRQYDAALQWLSGHQVRTQGSRLTAYRRIIARAEVEEANGRYSHQQRPELLNALIEASEIIEITQLDEAHLVAKDVLSKLKIICGGPEAMAPEGVDPARDYSLEFHTAAVLQREGEFGGFSLQGGDLTVGAGRFPAECKRVSSLSSLRKRLRSGRDQLKRLVDSGSPPGVIVLDLTRPIRMAHGPILAADDQQFEAEAEQRLIAYLASHVMTEQNIESLDCPAVLGVIARCLSAGTSGEDANIRRSVVWQACSIHAEDSIEEEMFRRVARAFGPGELREGTRNEIVAAMAQIPVVPKRGG